MANPEHVEIVKKGAKAITALREKNPEMRDLRAEGERGTSLKSDWATGAGARRGRSSRIQFVGGWNATCQTGLWHWECSCDCLMVVHLRGHEHEERSAVQQRDRVEIPNVQDISGLPSSGLRKTGPSGPRARFPGCQWLLRKSPALI